MKRIWDRRTVCHLSPIIFRCVTDHDDFICTQHKQHWVRKEERGEFGLKNRRDDEFHAVHLLCPRPKMPTFISRWLLLLDGNAKNKKTLTLNKLKSNIRFAALEYLLYLFILFDSFNRSSCPADTRMLAIQSDTITFSSRRNNKTFAAAAKLASSKHIQQRRRCGGSNSDSLFAAGRRQ